MSKQILSTNGEKLGEITLNDKKYLVDIIKKYYDRNKSALHPCFMDGAEYVLKHLNIITTKE